MTYPVNEVIEFHGGLEERIDRVQVSRLAELDVLCALGQCRQVFEQGPLGKLGGRFDVVRPCTIGRLFVFVLEGDRGRR